MQQGSDLHTKMLQLFACFVLKFKLDLYRAHGWLLGKPRQQAFTFTSHLPVTWFVSKQYISNLGAKKHHTFGSSLNDTHNSGREFYSLFSGHEKLYSWTQQTGKPYGLHMDSEHSYQQQCLYCTVLTEGRGCVCLCSSSVANTPAGDYGMHQKVMTVCTASRPDAIRCHTWLFSRDVMKIWNSPQPAQWAQLSFNPLALTQWGQSQHSDTLLNI